MRVQGLVFVGTRTTQPTAMTRFATQVLGLEARSADGSDAVFFDLPDGSVLAVQPVERRDDEERTVGFLVDDLEAAVDELHAAGHDVDDVARAGDLAYVHVRGPDGRLYELVQRVG